MNHQNTIAMVLQVTIGQKKQIFKMRNTLVTETERVISRQPAGGGK